MSVVIQLKGRLHELKLKRMELATGAGSHMDAIKDKLALSSTRALHEIDAEKVFYHAKELRRLWKEYREVSGEIGKIKKELGED
jgi:hypothetical protein